MKKIYTNQEILLLPASSFFKREWCENNNSTGNKKLSEKEKVIQLCWDGMIPEILPEIKETAAGEKPLAIWEVNETEQMLDLRMGQLDTFMNDEFSINPYVISELTNLN